MTDIPAGKVPVMDSVQHAFGYLKDSWTKWLPACALLSIVGGWSMLYSSSILEVLTGKAPLEGRTIGVMLLSELATLVVVAAIFRDTLRNVYTAPLGLGFSNDEFRLIGVGASLFLVFGILFVFLSILLSVAVFIVVASAGIDPSLSQTDPALFQAEVSAAMGTSVAGLLILLFIVGAVIFISTRLCLVQAATVAEQRMMIFQTWSWTKGNFWRILAGALIMIVPLFLVSQIVLLVLQNILIGEQSIDTLEGANPVSLFVLGVLSVILFKYPLTLMWSGYISYLYKGMRPSDEELEKLRQKAES